MSLYWIKGLRPFEIGCVFSLVAVLTLVTSPPVYSQATVVQQSPARQSSARQSAPPSGARVLKSGQVDTQKSRAYAQVAKTGLGHEHAIEGRLQQGSIQLGATQNAGSIVFDMTSYRADTAIARRYIGLAGTTSASTQRQTNQNMLGPSVLDVKMYPTSTFVINSAVPAQGKSRDGHPRYKLTGKFTLHGTTRPLAMNVEAIQEQDRIRLRGGFNIRQTSFGITPFKKAFGAVGVADQMTIYGEIYVASGSPVAVKEQAGTKR